MVHTNDLHRSFKATTNLANGLTKERASIQHELLKISHGKEELEELKKSKKVKEPLLTAEEKASKINKATIKGTGFNMEMVSSEKGKNMIEKQRDSRRQRHIEALKECEKFVEQFYDNFKERNNDIQHHIKVFLSGSDVEIEKIMKGLTDELLLANEIVYVNGVWDKVNQHREARREEVQHLRASFDDLKAFQQKGTGGYQESMRQNLIDIAFYLEPEVNKLLEQQVQDEKDKYAQEHVVNDAFHIEIVEKEKVKFDILYQQWKESVVKFHLIKQEDAIQRFLALMNSNKFVNPDPRIQLFDTVKSEQMRIFNVRLALLQQLERTSISQLTKDLVAGTDDNLRQINDEAQLIFDRLVEALAKDMENSNEDMDIALYDLKDFILKNDAQLEEGMTFDLLIEIRAKPTVDRRKHESKTLITGSVKYMEELDFKMNEICQNIVNFFKELATKLDTNKDKLKQTEINFQVALASCGDNNDEEVQTLEDGLNVKVDRMKKAIHHIQLNEKLQECFEMLDQITRQYRTYNQEYITLVQAHPTSMDTFYREFEKDCVSVFKMFDEGKRAEIHHLFTKETEARQRKLEEEALKKLEEEKKNEEAKKAEEDKNKPPVKGGAKPPAQQQKKGKDADKPLVDVPKLEIPKIIEYESQMGNKYLVQRKIEEIAQKLSEPVVEEEAKEEPVVAEPEPVPANGKQSQLQKEPPGQKQPPQAQQKPGQPAAQQKQAQPTPQQSQQLLLQQQQQQLLEQQLLEEKLREEAKPDYTKNFEPNDFLDKAEKRPPEDPFGVQTLHQDLIISLVQIQQILHITLNKALEYLYIEKMTYAKRVAREGKDLVDKNVDELDENLRKQWPRKGRLEVEVYQERKSQISAHNKKYERQVRVCLEKYNLLEEQWAYVLETVDGEFITFTQQQEKLKLQLPQGKNLAELQGVSRKEKDSTQTFEEKCREFQDKMYDIAVTQPDILVQQNDGMLKSCQLFEQGGNYASDEVDWYRQQMQEINEMVQKCKEQRDIKLKEVYAKMEKLMKEPNEIFEKNYKGSIVNLSAKEGLGKTFGQPRRLAQERLRAEMTKCEQAQKGVDSLLDKLESLVEKQEAGQFDYSKEKQSFSIEVRVALVSTIRCIAHYGQHLSGFLKDPKALPRMSYLEKQAELDVQPSEAGIIDEKRKEEELEHLGSIGFKNVTQAYLKFNESVNLIEKQSKEVCPKLYTGENAKFLVGPEKIPEYLTQFLEGMRKQAEEFRISCVRLLRTSALRLIEICHPLPKAVFGYLALKYTIIIENELDIDNKKFRDNKAQDDEQKKKHLKLFRPNLENPANKSLTTELNKQETIRTEAFKELIDDIQLKMLDIEQDRSLEFHNAYLNNMRGFIKAYDCLAYKEDFILLPGDEIIEKKHQNIKVLSAQAQKQDLSKRLTRKWAGLGPNVFEIDYPSLFAHFKEFKKDDVDSLPVQPPPVQQKGEPVQVVDPNKTEISHEIDIPNTVHHKSIVKSRNEHYEKFKRRFTESVKRIMEKFDNERQEEHRFNTYWAQNLKEITQKHI